MAQDTFDKVWVYGRVEPGWYVAKSVWDATYASDLREMGYTVERSVNKPVTSPMH